MGQCRLILILLGCALLGTVGCGASDGQSEPARPQAPASVATGNTAAAAASDANTAAEARATDAPAGQPTQTSTAQPAKVATSAATPDAAVPAPPASVPAPAPPVIEPATAKAALAVIDLETFPAPTIKQAFEMNASNISYTTAGTLSSVNTFAMKELSKAGWKESKHLVTTTDQYVDRMLEKNGYYLRLTVSGSGTDNEMMVTMSLLGNFDCRALPQTKDAQLEDSTAVMAGHRSSLPITDAYDDLSKRMVDAGWQIVQDYPASMPDVPHYRSIRFRKNAVRINLVFAKDPSKPSDKTSIYYHADSVMPFDVPMVDSKQPIKYDTTENRVLVPFRLDRPAMVELLAKNAKSFGWQLLGSDEFVDEKASVMYLSVGTPVGVAARLVETGGNYWISMNRAKLPTKADSKSANEQTNQVAQSSVPADDPAAKKVKAEIENDIANAGSAIDKAINDELTKALGSLSGNGPKPDMQALQAQAAKLQVQLSKGDAEESATTPAKKLPIVPDDTEPISDADRKITVTEARVKFGNREVVLKNCLAYAVMEDEIPTKILFFTDKPLKADKLDKLRDKGERFILTDGIEDAYPDASLELRLTETSSVFSFSGNGVSISTNANDIRSTVRLKNGKFQGRVTLDKPIEIQNGHMTFEVTVSQNIRR